MSNPTSLAAYIEQKLGHKCFINLNTGMQGYEQIVQFLLEINVEARKKLYEIAKEEMWHLGQEMYAKRSLHLWLFSHPTFEVFNGFLADNSLVENFVSFVTTVLRSRKRGSRIVRSKLCNEIAQTQTMQLFLTPYLELVRLTTQSYHLDLGNVGKKSPPGLVPLAMISYPDDADTQRAHVNFFLTQIKTTAEQSLVTEVTHELRNFANLLLNHDLLIGSVEQSLPKLYEQYGTPRTKAVGTYLYNVDIKLCERICAAMLRGAWVRFSPITQKRCELVVDMHADDLAVMQKTAIMETDSIVQPMLNSWSKTKCGCLPVGLKVHVLKPLSKSPPKFGYQ